jgi:hypothetical protein
MFGTFDKPSIFSAGYSTANKDGREALSKAMISRVKNFIHSIDGNPNLSCNDNNKCPKTTDDTSWKLWSPKQPNELIFDADIKMVYRTPEPKPDIERDPVPKECIDK